MKREAWLGLWVAAGVLACHPRTEVTPPSEPPCLGASVSRLHHRVHEGMLLIEQQIDRYCPRPGEPASSVERVAAITLGQQSGCPAGQVALEARSANVSRLMPDLPAIPPALLEHVGDALRNFSHVHGRGSGLAFLLSCDSPPRWLFVTLDTVQPLVQEFSEAAPSTPSVDQPTGVVEAERAEPPPAPLKTGTCDEKIGRDPWVGRLLSTGTMPGPSRMTKWLLGREKDRGELLIQEFETVERSRGEDNPHGAWKCTRSAAYEGTFSGSRFSLGQPPDGPRKALVCALKTMKVADADARRVRVARPAPGEGCNASRWSSPRKTELQVLVCADGEGDPFFLAAGPGVERVVHDEDVLYDEPNCTGTPAALRSVPVDGGVATAIRASEAPR